jgi:DNA invertase Pin-like site-specific DNA recombinase
MSIIDVYEDVDISGFKRVVRPSFDRLLQDLASGRVDGFIAYRVERVLRNWRDWVRMEDIREKHGGFCLTLDGNDSRTPTGRTQFELFVYMAKLESERISERTKRKHDDTARKGMPHRGGPRPYGYEQGHDAIRESEAAFIREAVRRVLAGDNLTSICRWLREAGATTPSGNYWGTATLRHMLRLPHLAGIRTHHGEQTQGTWEPIISMSDHKRVLTVLNARRPEKPGPWTHYLLSGIATCGGCGGAISGRKAWRSGEPLYICQPRPNTDNCGRVSRLMTPVDAVVKRKLVEALAVHLPNLEVLGKGESRVLELEEMVAREEQALQDLNDACFVERVIDRTEHARLSAVISGRLSAARKALADSLGRSRLAAITTGNVAEVWDVMGLEWRRTVLRETCGVTIHPAGRGNRTFNPDLVTLELRGL